MNASHFTTKVLIRVFCQCKFSFSVHIAIIYDKVKTPLFPNLCSSNY